jgi:Fe-S oxidoreductase
MDKRILDLTKEHIEQKKNRFFVEGEPGAILVIEFYGEDEQDCERQAEEAIEALQAQDLGYSYPYVWPPNDDRVWKLRKAGLGILMGIKGDTKPVTVVEDTAVGLEDLPDYANDFAGIMAEYDTQCVYYAHASVGELHLRPELNLKTVEDADKFREIAEDVTDLVADYGGSISGEHGDGRVRSPLLEQFYGEELVDVFGRVKAAFDPKGILNPNNIVDPEPLDEHWRVNPGQETPDYDTYFDWSDDGGLVRAVEKCNGAGVCRKRAEAGGTMCPSYMATLDEKDTTRGRANVFRQVLYEADPAESFADETLHETLDLCLSCKGCKNECPANVDMARMKSEFQQHYYDENGTPISAEIFGNYRRYARLASIVPWLANFLASFVLTRWVMDWWVGTAPERQFPEFASERFSSWFERRESLSADEAEQTVWLFSDPFTEFNDPEVGRAAVRVLESAGIRVELLPIDEDGRTQLSKGLVDRARDITADNLETLAPLFDEHPERPIVGLEPSALLTFRDETPDLAPPDRRDVAEELADRSYLFEEFVEQATDEAWFDAPWSSEELGTVHLHGHCHQKAIVGAEPTEQALEIAGYEVETIPSGCCGMAGSFGYEEDHYELSMDIGELVLFPEVRELDDADAIAAPGTSCRSQIKDGTAREAEHPAILLERALDE